tara:strand:+ start:40445 stop:41185 length:741 start_codon:yes stop_codon:yes gene_type:complete
MRSITKKNTTYYTNSPFTVFEIDNFLEENEYYNLLKTFPKEDLFGNSTEGNAIDPDNPIYLEHLGKYPVWKNFIDKLNSQRFINTAYFFSLIPNIKSRGLKAFKKWTQEDIKFPLNKLLKRVSVEAHFTILRKNEHLNPHTDATSKLLSMIFYFAEDKTKLSKNGTEFWKNVKNFDYWKNWNNRHIVDNKELEKFKKENEIFFKSTFEKNKLVGFIKNDISWHSVTNFYNNTDEIRKAFVINIRSK